MVQQISVQQISTPKAEPKEKVQQETASFKTALKKAESSLPSKELKSESGKEDTQIVGGEKVPVAEEEKLSETNLQNNIVSPLMLWLLTGNATPGEQSLQSSAESLTAAAPQILPASSEPALTALTAAIASAAEKTDAAQQVLPQQTNPQVLTFASAVQTANSPVAQQTTQQAQAAPILSPQLAAAAEQPVAEEAVLPQLAGQAVDSLSVSSKTEQKENRAVPQMSAPSADAPSTAATIPVPVQAQQNDLGSALSGHPQEKAADATGSTSEQNSDFAGLLVGQNDSAFSSSTVHASASSKLSAGTTAHLTEQIAKNVQVKNNSFRMELFPQDLGKVTVSLKMEQGLLVVDLLADSSKTQSLLASASGEIRSLLESAVGQPVQVTQPSQDAPAYYQQEQESSGQQQGEQHSQQHQDQETTEDFLSVLQRMKEQSISL
jgi:flagellar hook-length control protein FliK